MAKSKKERQNIPIPKDIEDKLLKAVDYFNEGWISEKKYKAIRKKCNLDMRAYILKSRKKPE